MRRRDGAFLQDGAARLVAADAYAYATMLQAAAVQPGSRIGTGGVVCPARAQSRARRHAISSSPSSSLVWTAALPGSTPSRPRRATQSCDARRTSSWPSLARRTHLGRFASGVAGEDSCGLDPATVGWRRGSNLERVRWTWKEMSGSHGLCSVLFDLRFQRKAYFAE